MRGFIFIHGLGRKVHDGHGYTMGLQILHKIKLFPKLKQIYLDFCEHYVYGKQKRVIFLRVGKEKKIERLELVHIDV
jgi:hypothetical protein